MGSGSSATIKFDGTFSKDDEDIPAVIADGKIELQKWWDASEKQEQDIEDIITVKYTNVQVVYEYEGTSSDLLGDVNADGKVNIADVVTLQKFLLGTGTLKSWKNADLYSDQSIDSFDMVLLRKLIIQNA